MITGVRGTGNILQARRVVDIAKKIDVLEPDSAPLIQLTKKLAKRVAINPRFSWIEEEGMNRVDTINWTTGYTTSQTTIAVNNGNRFRAGDVVKAVASGEQLLVSNVAGNDLTVVRGWGATSAGNIAHQAVLLIVGNAHQEGSTMGTIRTTLGAERVNFLQIFRTPFGVTRTVENSEMHGGNDMSHTRMMQLIEHQKDIERAFWFGEPREDLSGTHPRRATGGVDHWISTNSTGAGGTLTEASFEAWLRTGFRFGSSTKFIFAAPIVISAVSSWARGRLQLLPRDKTYGIAVTQYLSPHGVVNLVNMKLFAETAVYAGHAFLVDIESIAYRYLSNSDTRLKTNIQAPSEDGQTDEYISEVGLELKNERRCAQLTGVTSFS